MVGVSGAAIVAAGLAGCSSKPEEGTRPAAGTATTAGVTETSGTLRATSGTASVTAGAGSATVTIDGQPREVQGQVVCTTAMGNLSIAVGEQATGVAVVMAPDASRVTSVGLGNVDGVTLGYQEGAPGGSATASKEGQAYTISGTATGVDMANPMQPVTKPFEIAVTCP